jgi:ribosomal protein L7/L12
MSETAAVFAVVALVVSVVAISMAAASMGARSDPRSDIRMARLEKRMEEIASHVGLPPAPVPAGMEDVLALIQAGQKIPAIKRYRELTGVGLREAKGAVEDLESQAGL